MEYPIADCRYALNILSLTINRRVDYEVEGGRDLDLMHSRGLLLQRNV